MKNAKTKASIIRSILILMITTCLLLLLCSAALAENKPQTQPQTQDKECSYHHHKCKCGKAHVNRQRVRIGPYLSLSKRYDGSELLVNEPSVRESPTLLQYIYDLKHTCANLGVAEPLIPNLTLSGYGELQYFSDQLQITGGELDAFAQLNQWVSVFTAIDYDPSGTIPNQNLINRYFVIIGNLNQSPFYGTIGQIFAPFGQFTTNMVTDPQSKTLGRVRAQAVMFGYHQPTGYHAHIEVYLYQGVNVNNNTPGSTGFGVDGGINSHVGPVHIKLGVSFISNIGESMGLLGAIGNLQLVNRDIVPGADIYSYLEYRAFSLIAEYVAALDSFNKNVLAYQNQGAKPSALDIELAFSFKTFGKPSSVAIAFGHAEQVAALALSKQRYSIVYNVSLIRNTTLSFELVHDVGLLASNGTFVNDNVFTIQLNMYF